MPSNLRKTFLLVETAAIVVATFACRVLIAVSFLSWFAIATPLLYFAWRPVRAVERIADAMEEVCFTHTDFVSWSKVCTSTVRPSGSSAKKW